MRVTFGCPAGPSPEPIAVAEGFAFRYEPECGKHTVSVSSASAVCFVRAYCKQVCTVWTCICANASSPLRIMATG